MRLYEMQARSSARCAASSLKVRVLKNGRVCLIGIMTCNFGRRPLRGLLPQSARFEKRSRLLMRLYDMQVRSSAAARPPPSKCAF